MVMKKMIWGKTKRSSRTARPAMDRDSTIMEVGVEWLP